MTNPKPITDAYESILGSVRRHPLGALLTTPLFVLAFLAALVWWNFPALLSIYERWNDREFERRILQEDDARERAALAILVDEQIRARLLRLRQQSAASRAVVRAFVFDMDQSEQILAIVDVFETMDIRTEETGIRNRKLPLPAIQRTLNYMLASDVPRCIGRNVEDYDDPDLRDFLLAAGLQASVACPLRDMDGRPIGIIAVSIRTPLEENELVRPMTRDAALEIGAYLTLSQAYSNAILSNQPKD